MKGTLKDHLKSLPTPAEGIPAMPYRNILHFTSQISAGLEYLHSKDIVHRELRSSNILLGPDDVPKIADYGISQHYDFLRNKCRYNCDGSSIYYRAPECFARSKERLEIPQVDTWAFGTSHYIVGPEEH